MAVNMAVHMSVDMAVHKSVDMAVDMAKAMAVNTAEGTNFLEPFMNYYNPLNKKIIKWLQTNFFFIH